MKQSNQRSLKWIGIAVASPFVLFLLLAIIVYLPPVQNYAVRRVAAELSESMGLRVSVGHVRLAFPLDLVARDMLAMQDADTVLDARSLHLDVAFWPLLKGRADIEGFSLTEVKVDTKDFIADTRVKGHLRYFDAMLHGVAWRDEQVRVDHAVLRDATLAVALSDTAQKDTTQLASRWNIEVDKIDISNTALSLSMPGDSMRVAARLGEARLRGGLFDTGRPYYAVRSFTVTDGSVAYDMGSNAPQRRVAAPPADLLEALTAITPAKGSSKLTLPVKPLDVNHIRLAGVNLQVDTLSYDAAGTLRCGVRNVSLAEQCGLSVSNLSGAVYLDTLKLALPALNLRTPNSNITAGVQVDWAALSPGGNGRMQVSVDAAIGRADIVALATGMVPAQMLNALPAVPLNVKASVGGNMDCLLINRFTAGWPGALSVGIDGTLRNVTADNRSGALTLDARAQNLVFAERLLPAAVRSAVSVPRGITARGTLNFKGDIYSTRMRIGTGGGTLALTASTNLKSETYDVKAQARRFPLKAFVKGMELGGFSGGLKAQGRGFDPMARGARSELEAKIEAFSYDHYPLGGIDLKAALKNRKAEGSFHSTNELVRGKGRFEVDFNKQLAGALRADFDEIDLHRLAGMADSLTLGASLRVAVDGTADLKKLKADGEIFDIRFNTPKKSLMAKDIAFGFSTTREETTARVGAGDLTLRLAAGGGLEKVGKQATAFVSLLQKQLGARELEQEALRQVMPLLSFSMQAGDDNPLAGILKMKGYTFSTANIGLQTSPETGLTGHANIGLLRSGGLQIDTVDCVVLQDSGGVKINTYVKNYLKSNPNKFEATVNSYLLPSGAGVELMFTDAKGRRGIDVGLRAELQDAGINLHLYPQHPVIAYRTFTLNADNYIFLGKNKDIRAEVDLLADDGTGLKIYGAPADTLGVNDLNLSLSNVNLAELSQVLPYLPKLSGMLSGDIHATAGEHSLSAAMSMEARSFAYEDVQLGTIGLECVYLPKGNDEHHASAFVSSNGTEVLECSGVYYDRDGGTFEGDVNLHDFPMQMLNGFLAGTDVALKGKAGGEFSVKGFLNAPVMNGKLDLDSAHIYSDVYGFDFLMDERPVLLENSRLAFQNYELRSTGKNPLVLNGGIDLRDFSNIGLDFTMRANNFELINTKRNAQSMVYGKVFADYVGSLRGTASNIVIRGKLNVLDKTDVTYILKDSPLTVEDRLSSLVKFVDFNDTLTVEPKVEPESSFDMTLGISISDAAMAHCLLSEDGESYVNLEGGGDLTMRITQQGDMRMTGRYTVQQGEMKYALPVIPLKTFNLVSGSYVDFTGDIMNPTLNIAAKERVKAVVSDDAQPRSVAFDVGVRITKPLEEMGLEFTIEAPEDLSVQNQLASMSAEQRGKTAVAMLATGMYVTDETMTGTGGFKASNALNAFLQSEIQNIAGNALKTIDINLGVENGTSVTGGTTTDYSFQFSKRFLDNRISVIVGGKVSTGADAQNSAESFIDNVSVEYRLDKSATRYVRVFYDRGVQDPLEGQLTKTGAGLVLRRKTERLGELFLFKNKSK